METSPVVFPLVIRAREFQKSEIKEIEEIISFYSGWGSWRVSILICEKLNWFQSNTWPKDRACRDALAQLFKLGLISKIEGREKSLEIPPDVDPIKRYYGKKTETAFNKTELVCGKWRLRLAKGGPREKEWNKLIRDDHYRGHTVTVGRALKFFVYYEEVLIGAFSLAESSYNVGPRDRLLSEMGVSRQEVVNNARFLVLPEVSRPNFASQILSLMPLAVTEFWNQYYVTNAKFLETFVEISKFRGTCYKAANWIKLGKTRGFSKNGSKFSKSESPKDIYLIGLSKKSKRHLSRILKYADSPPPGT